MAFDPHAAARAASTGRRGKRWRYLLAGVTALAVGAYAFDDWIASLFSPGTADAKPDIMVSNAEPFVPSAAPPPQPAPQAVAPKVEPAKAGPAHAAPKLPTRIAWNNGQAQAPDMPWFHDGRRPVLAKGCALRPHAAFASARPISIGSAKVGWAVNTAAKRVRSTRVRYSAQRSGLSLGSGRSTCWAMRASAASFTAGSTPPT